MRSWRALLLSPLAALSKPSNTASGEDVASSETWVSSTKKFRTELEVDATSSVPKGFRRSALCGDDRISKERKKNGARDGHYSLDT